MYRPDPSAAHACIERRLIIELDGSQHRQALDRDAARDAFLRKRGFVMLRFWNNEVLNEMQAVLDRIWATAFLPPPSPRPSPAGAGEGDSPRAHR